MYHDWITPRKLTVKNAPSKVFCDYSRRLNAVYIFNKAIQISWNNFLRTRGGIEF